MEFLFTKRCARLVDSVVANIGQDLISVVSVQFDVLPDQLLWVINLIHDEAHKQVDYTVADNIYLSG